MDLLCYLLKVTHLSQPLTLRGSLFPAFNHFYYLPEKFIQAYAYENVCAWIVVY